MGSQPVLGPRGTVGVTPQNGRNGVGGTPVVALHMSDQWIHGPISSRQLGSSHLDEDEGESPQREEHAIDTVNPPRPNRIRPLDGDYHAEYARDYEDDPIDINVDRGSIDFLIEISISPGT